MAELRGRKNNRLGLGHCTRFTLKTSEPQISGRMNGFQGQKAETENQLTVSERDAKVGVGKEKEGGLFRLVIIKEGKRCSN